MPDVAIPEETKRIAIDSVHQAFETMPRYQEVTEATGWYLSSKQGTPDELRAEGVEFASRKLAELG